MCAQLGTTRTATLPLFTTANFKNAFDSGAVGHAHFLESALDILKVVNCCVANCNRSYHIVLHKLVTVPSASKLQRSI